MDGAPGAAGEEARTPGARRLFLPAAPGKGQCGSLGAGRSQQRPWLHSDGRTAVGRGRPEVGVAFPSGRGAETPRVRGESAWSLFLLSSGHPGPGGPVVTARGRRGGEHGLDPRSSPRKRRPGAGRVGATVARTGFEVRICAEHLGLASELRGRGSDPNACGSGLEN